VSLPPLILLPPAKSKAGVGRGGLDVVDVRFLRPDGRAASAARTEVCKGRLAAALVARPDLDPASLVDGVDPARAGRGGPKVTASRRRSRADTQARPSEVA
jgi:hypothetical protein